MKQDRSLGLHNKVQRHILRYKTRRLCVFAVHERLLVAAVTRICNVFKAVAGSREVYSISCDSDALLISEEK